MRKFIGFAGKKQVGKDTSAQIVSKYISTVHNNFPFIMHFADDLKNKVEELYGISRSAPKEGLTHLNWDSLSWEIRLNNSKNFVKGPIDNIDKVVMYPVPRTGPMTVREVYQVYGEMCRGLDRNIWINSLFRRAPNYGIILIADVRMPEEVKRIKESGGAIIKIERETGLVDNDISEISLSDYNGDFKIENNSTITELETQLNTIVDQILRG